LRYATFIAPDGRTVPAIVEGDRLRVIDAPSMRAYIALDARARASALTETTFSLAQVRLDAPVRPSRNVFCVGRNYLEHAREGAQALGRDLKLPDVPTFFTKAPTAIAAPDSTLELQARVSREYDYEAELAVIVAMRCKDVPEAQWRDVVFGYTCLNDVTARDLQRSHGQWFKGKSLDDTCPLGPWIAGASDLDPANLDISLTLCGEPRQRGSTSQMIFPIPRLIAELSAGMTLEPGDVIATGTPAGVGFARTPPEFLKDGDEMAVHIEGIGTLRNHIHIS
jgi:2-keto-4-pentenoate hydratase/2-oxohepta-3-ene-1,7-dioic acid hydratase in catechol pathway